MMEISFRPINKNDFAFLWRLHKAALQMYVAKTWGWDEDWQRRHFTEEFDPVNGTIIVVDGSDAGFWRIIEHEGEIDLASILLSPEFQNRGIGTMLIRDLVGRAGR